MHYSVQLTHSIWGIKGDSCTFMSGLSGEPEPRP